MQRERERERERENYIIIIIFINYMKSYNYVELLIFERITWTLKSCV